VEGFCEHGNESQGSVKCWQVLGFSRRAQLYEVRLTYFTSLRYTTLFENMQ
jgi:hypothetical protein